MTPAQLRSFLERFASGKASDAEHQQFIDWLQTASVADVEAVQEEYRAIAATRTTGEGADPQLASSIEAALDQYEMGKGLLPESGRTIPWRKVLKIAAVLVIGFATFFIVRKHDHPIAQQQQAQPEKNIVAPGGDKAILTLADGSTIILDDTRNGQVAKQGGTQISRQGNGQIVYHASGENTNKVVFNTLTTPRGGQFSIILPDGSKVWLNAVSSIRYPTAFTGKERKVDITGEVYFEIAQDASKPFKVSVQDMEVKVLGTHFNINAYTDEDIIKTTLLSGSISVARSGAVVTLKPGQQARAGNSQPLKVIDHVQVDEEVAWKQGYFSFYKADLQTVMRQIARWYDVEIVYEGNPPVRQFGGKIDRSANISDVLKILEETKVNFRMEHRKIIVRP
jgi:ferric-dicitrate binding protein FerR (iron transport regulator)